MMPAAPHAPHEIIAVVRRHQDIVDVFRLMKDRLGLTNEFIDNVGGLTKGHTDKILGPTETRSWGPTTFDLFCELFAVEFRVHIDLAAVKRMEAVWEGRKRAVEISETRRISVKLIEKAKPHVLREIGRVGGLKSACQPTARLRNKKAGKSRMRKVTRAQRVEMAHKGWITRKSRSAALAALAAAESGSLDAMGNASASAVPAVRALDCAK